MNAPLGSFEVDCDGSACGAGSNVTRHVHPPQYNGPAATRVIVRSGEIVGHKPAEGITRLTLITGEWPPTPSSEEGTGQ